MATYSSPTNPFIETTSIEDNKLKIDNKNKNQHDRSLTKIAPGQARPHKVFNVNNNVTSIGSSSSSKNNNNNDRDCCKSMASRSAGLTPIDEAVDGLERDLLEMAEDAALDCKKEEENTAKVESASMQSSNNNKIRPAQQNGIDKEEATVVPIKVDKGEDEEDDHEAEIAKTCQSLVEVATRLSLDEERPASIALNSTKLSASARPMQSFVEEEEDDDDEVEEGPKLDPTKRTSKEQDNRQHQHLELIKKLRLQLRDLERYAYERGELGEQVPASVLAERRQVIIETLKKKLSLNLDGDKMEKLELDELKEQVDKEIDDLIDPLLTREHLLKQLKTQLTDLERYIGHLHLTLGQNSRRLSASSIGNNNSNNTDCTCPKHGLYSPTTLASSSLDSNGIAASEISVASTPKHDSILDEDALPRTSRLIRALMAQLICSDIDELGQNKRVDSHSGMSTSASSSNTSLAVAGGNNEPSNKSSRGQESSSERSYRIQQQQQPQAPITKTPQFHDGATWTLHLDKVILATDSLVNLYSMSGQNGATVHQPTRSANENSWSTSSSGNINDALVESVVRRQLIPALRDLLCYGLIDPSTIPRSTSYTSFLFDPYYLFSSLTCFPGLTGGSASQQNSSSVVSHHEDGKIHLWDIFEDYYNSRSETNNFKNSSVKTLSQSFQLTPSMHGPIKITSKQALLIAIDDVIQLMVKCKPNGPESHLKMLIYVALNQGKLATWLRIILKNKSVIRKYYHNFSFVSQPEKIDRFLAIVDSLSKIRFKLNTDVEQKIALDQFVSAF